MVCSLGRVVGVAAGYYLWLDAKVSAANDRVSDDVRRLWPKHPCTTVPAVIGTTTRPGADDHHGGGSRVSGRHEHPAGGLRQAFDHRQDYGLSDTIMLVHVDPGNNYLSTISFPRDLRVDVKGYGKQKLNAAYSYGGPALSIRTIQSLTGIDIDHYLEVDFKAFRDMTDKLGGVYVEVDRRYYYDGWQLREDRSAARLSTAGRRRRLDYVRFRHDANLDFGRMERQQRFLSALRQQAMGWDLGLKLPGLIGAFFDNVTTDLGTNEFIKLAWWGVALDGSRIRQVTLRGGYADDRRGLVRDRLQGQDRRRGGELPGGPERPALRGVRRRGLCRHHDYDGGRASLTRRRTRRL